MRSASIASALFVVSVLASDHLVHAAAPSTRPAAAPAKVERSQPASRSVRNIEGWTVRVDDRLLTPNNAVGEKALRVLGNKLSDIKAVVPAGAIAKLQKVTIVVDLECGGLGSMQYHPSAGWLREHGYPAELEKCVHIPLADELCSRLTIVDQPWVVLHELSHAYHDQVLGTDEPRIRKAYEQYKKSGRGDQVLHRAGKPMPHYALSNPDEFFAEMTEAYFGVNDFFPFNRAELMTAEPQIEKLIRSIWEGADGSTVNR